MRYLLSILVSLFLSTSALASQFYYCSKTMKTVYLGDSIAAVQEACGQPTSIDKDKQNLEETPSEIYRLTYKKILPMDPKASDNSARDPEQEAMSAEAGVSPSEQVKILLVDIGNDKVMKLTLDGRSLNSTEVCDNNIIQTGSEVSEVYNACGDAISMEKLNENETKSAVSASSAIIFTYSSGSYGTSTKLFFKQDKLVQITP